MLIPAAANLYGNLQDDIQRIHVNSTSCCVAGKDSGAQACYTLVLQPARNHETRVKMLLVHYQILFKVSYSKLKLIQCNSNELPQFFFCEYPCMGTCVRGANMRLHISSNSNVRSFMTRAHVFLHRSLFSYWQNDNVFL